MDAEQPEWKSAATEWEYSGTVNDLDNVHQVSIGLLNYTLSGTVYIDNLRHRFDDSLVIYPDDPAVPVITAEAWRWLNTRPRGYSCEEIGGAFFGWDENFARLDRLSDIEPLFVSPHGTGSSRYADAVFTTDGLLATWQQSQPDVSQPLVRHFVPLDEVERVFRGSDTS